MEVDKQLRFKSHKSMTVEFILTNVDATTHGCLSSVVLALHNKEISEKYNDYRINTTFVGLDSKL